MCGIVGMIHEKSMIQLLTSSLRRLEYRGYDSAGIAVFEKAELIRYRALGVLDNLQETLPSIEATVGMGHTRWATHGEPSATNAHPHFSHRVAIVHNGIVENFTDLKVELQKKGYVFSSDTDTEVMAHLMDSLYTDPSDIVTPFINTINQLEGNFAIACMVSGWENHMLVARRGTPPLLVGRGDLGHSISSDALGLADVAHTVGYLESETCALVSVDSVQAYTFLGQAVDIQWQAQPLRGQDYHQGNYAHFMRKEIDEQPDVIAGLLERTIPALPDLCSLDKDAHVSLLGCGTSFYAAWIGKYILEHRHSVTLELASEFSYRCPKMIPGVTLALSQSGETADTLKAVAYAQNQGQCIVSLLNAPHSSLARCSHHVLDMQAGPEIGVASTKAFTAQLWLLFALAGIESRRAVDLPQRMGETLALSPEMQRWAQKLQSKSSILYMGRGVSYPVALEGALKMKELSYIHAEGLAAGELKHGSLALVDEHMPIVFLAPSDGVFEKSLSNIHEIIARKGLLYVITDAAGAGKMPIGGISEILVLPDAPEPIFNPFLQTLVLQLLAYYTALALGCSIDKPRNLAKSVTVE